MVPQSQIDVMINRRSLQGATDIETRKLSDSKSAGGRNSSPWLYLSDNRMSLVSTIYTLFIK